MYFIALSLIIPGLVMLFDHSRGFFMMVYSFIFIITIVWNLFHGFSDVDDQVLWAEV